MLVKFWSVTVTTAVVPVLVTVPAVVRGAFWPVRTFSPANRIIPVMISRCFKGYSSINILMEETYVLEGVERVTFSRQMLDAGCWMLDTGCWMLSLVHPVKWV